MPPWPPSQLRGVKQVKLVEIKPGGHVFDMSTGVEIFHIPRPEGTLTLDALRTKAKTGPGKVSCDEFQHLRS